MSGGFLLSGTILNPTTTPEELAGILGTSYKKLKYFYYRGRMLRHYSVFTIPKKSGGTREIYSPGDQLKTLQSRIALQLSMLYKPKKVVKAFVEGGSIVENSIPHVRKKFVFNIDLQDFFPSITFARVRGLLAAKPYSLTPETATVIAHLVTVSGFLPQGAPSSPVISNMICASLDRELFTLGMRHSAAYTRYADDITFSFRCPITYLPDSIVCISGPPDRMNHYGSRAGNILSQIITRHGFTINESKVRLQGVNERQIVTGLTVNSKPNVDRRYIRKTSALIHSLEFFGSEQAGAINAQKRPDATNSFEAHIQGRLLFINQVVGVQSKVYRRLALRFNMLPTAYKVPLPPLDSAGDVHAFKINKSVIKKCWVVEADATINEELYIFQGSAFMVEGDLLITCAHVLESEGTILDDCEVFRVDSRDVKFKAKVVHRDSARDLAILKIEHEARGFEFFSLERVREPNIGERIAVLGFPNYKSGSVDVGSLSVKITNKYPLGVAKVLHSEVDKTLYSGNSGGPVINSSQHIVGVAAKGAASNPEGHNTFISVSELTQTLNNYKATLAIET
ncbi:trypsin-like peptidase domain-containing protein [Pseudomonas sp. 6D_7.1_Bac1]|uniref:trypsin-like peptidase domain-containing protein n=1 Tax=Pseudomonas sp. 6D_7.1_Bac1 TaxID=2971615 RepID=UPI0021CA5482|nr:trypsin-like peptidase domain-containing protein [Pseudomonas sp. 6D_7.1_Bac1]MCU1751752.1 trypsin-like peptidase domain-containing protein [Pseudomonas sp. 6D_7.1_Bac1]